MTVVEALGIHLDVLVGHRTFTEFHPRTGAKDALLVDVHPGLNPIEYLRFLLVVCTVGTQRHTEQQVAVLAYDIHELLDDIGRTLVASPFIDAGVVMPSTDAVASLPRFIHNLVGGTPLHIPGECLALLLIENLAEHDGTRILVVEMGGNLQSAVTDIVEWHNGHVKVNQVGLVAVDGIEGSVVEVGDKLFRWQRSTIAPCPLAMNRVVGP